MTELNQKYLQEENVEVDQFTELIALTLSGTGIASLNDVHPSYFDLLHLIKQISFRQQ